MKPAASPASRKSVTNNKAVRTSVAQPTDTLPPVKTSVFDEHKEQTVDEQQAVLDKTAELSVRDRFTVLQSSFTNFSTDLQQLQATASSADAALLQSLTTQLTTLTQQLDAETTTRTTEHLTLHTAIQAQLDQLATAITTPLTAQLADLTTTITTLQTDLIHLTTTTTTDRTTVPALIDARIADVKADERRAVDEARRHEAERREREQALVNRLVGLERQVMEERKVERGMWEAKLTALRLEWDEERRLREREWSEWRERVRVEMAELRQSAEKERQERVETDELIGAAVQKYTSELQDGIRIVASKQK